MIEITLIAFLILALEFTLVWKMDKRANPKDINSKEH